MKKVSQKNAERLTFTEDTYLCNEAAMQVFEREAAVTEYEFVCTGDGETCDICRGLSGERFKIAERVPGLNFPPMHPWCRCFFDPVIPGKKMLTSGADSGIIKKISGALNPDSERADEHAQRYYAAVRKMKTDVSRIARNTGFSSELVQSIKDFIFMEKHELGDRTDYFDPDYKMAESWQRLIDGKDIKPHDLTLLKHEQMERDLMKQGYSQAEAHKITSKTYNYAKEAYEYYDSIEKHKGKS